MIVFDSPIEIQVGQLCFYDFEAGPSLVGITVFDQRQETMRSGSKCGWEMYKALFMNTEF